MAVSPEDLAAGTLALQVFVKNAKNVEMVVDIAFAVVPTLLGFGAAGLIGSAIIRTAKEVRNSISLLGVLGKLRWRGGGKDDPPTPAPAPAPAAEAGMMAMAEAGRGNQSDGLTFPIILTPPTIKIPDKGEAGRQAVNEKVETAERLLAKQKKEKVETVGRWAG